MPQRAARRSRPSRTDRFGRRLAPLLAAALPLLLAACAGGLVRSPQAAADPDELREASTELARQPTPTQLWARGECLLAWTYDRTLLGVLHRQGSVGDAAAASVARRSRPRTGS